MPRRLTPERVAELGREPDHVLAERWGVSRIAVLQARRRRGIPALGRWPKDKREGRDDAQKQ